MDTLISMESDFISKKRSKVDAYTADRLFTVKSITVYQYLKIPQNIFTFLTFISIT